MCAQRQPRKPQQHKHAHKRLHKGGQPHAGNTGFNGVQASVCGGGQALAVASHSWLCCSLGPVGDTHQPTVLHLVFLDLGLAVGALAARRAAGDTSNETLSEMRNGHHGELSSTRTDRCGSCAGAAPSAPSGGQSSRTGQTRVWTSGTPCPTCRAASTGSPEQSCTQLRPLLCAEP